MSDCKCCRFFESTNLIRRIGECSKILGPQDYQYNNDQEGVMRPDPASVFDEPYAATEDASDYYSKLTVSESFYCALFEAKESVNESM